MKPIIVNGEIVNPENYKEGQVYRFDRNDSQDMHWILTLTKIDGNGLHYNATPFGKDIPKTGRNKVRSAHSDYATIKERIWNSSFDIYLMESDEEIEKLKLEALASEL